jgi:hypothetical protein
MEQKMKQIQYAGYSILKDGTWKFRTATDQKRVFQLEAFGEAVYMIGIKPVATKSQAAKELLAMDYMGKDQACVDFFVQHAKDENPFKRSARVVKITVPSMAMVELTGATVKIGRGALGKVFPEIKMTPKQAEQHRAEFNARAKDLV